MIAHDPYDVRNAFDDVLGGAPDADIIDMAGETLRALRGRRLRTVPQRLEVVGCDSTPYTFEPADVTVLGADEGVPEGAFPVFDRIRSRFRLAIGRPKLVRVDDQNSYKKFRAERAKPHLQSLLARLSKLEGAFAEHVADHHGERLNNLEDSYGKHLVEHRNDESRLSRLEHDETDLSREVASALRGGQRVEIPLPHHMVGKVECWHDGDEVLVSAKTPWGIVTTGSPIADHLHEVAGAAESVGCCGLEVLLIGCELAPRVVGEDLLGCLCGAAPELQRVEAPYVGALVPVSDPGLASGMFLLQAAQRGSHHAAREAHQMAARGYRHFLKEAADRLTRGQQLKAKGRLS